MDTGSTPVWSTRRNPCKYWIFPLFTRVLGVLRNFFANAIFGILNPLFGVNITRNITRKKGLFFLYFQGITAPLLCAYIVFFYDIVEFFFLFDVSVGSYPIRGNHPAVRIKRIRLPVNLADDIMQISVSLKHVPPFHVLVEPAFQIFPAYPSV